MPNEQVIFDVGFRVTPQEESRLRQRFDQFQQSLKLNSPFASLTSGATGFSRELDRATQRVITLGTAFNILSTSARIFRDIVRNTVEVEKALTDINAIFKLTDQNLARFSNTLFDISRDTAKSFDDVAKAATEFARQGLSVARTQEAVRAALILSRDANIDVTDSVKALTAATNSFQKEALTYGQIVNRLAAADSAFAVSSKDLQEALIRTGSAASDAGISFNELIGLVTSAQQITARGGSVIAGALNTIFTRVNRRDTLDALDALGVAVTDTQGRMLGTLDVLKNFSRAYDGMTGSIKNQAAELVGGVRQLNTLKAVLDDLSKSNSVFAQTQQQVANATNEADLRNAARNQSLAAQLERAKTNAQQIGSNIGNVGFGSQAKSVIGTLNNNPITAAFAEAGTGETAGGVFAQQFLKGFGGAVIYGLGPIILTGLALLTKKVLGNVIRDVAEVAKMNGVENERLAVEAEVVKLFEAGGVALQQQLRAMNSLTEQAAKLKELMSTAGIAAIPTAPLAAAIQASGFKRTPRAAGGYLPFGEENAAIAAGVGGATSSARSVYLPSFNRGGGQRGIVANTSEWMVNTAAGGAIFNRDMIAKVGLPPGATPVAAEGYVPNAPGGYLPRDLGLGYSQAGVEKTASLNELFVNISKAATVAEASKFGPQIIDIAAGLSKVASSRVLKDLAQVFNDLTYTVTRYNTTGKASPEALGAWMAGRSSGPWNPASPLSGGTIRPYGPTIPLQYKLNQWQDARQQGALSRQAALNEAMQQLDSGGISSLSRAQQELHYNELRKQAIQDLGFKGSLPSILSNKDASAQINAQVTGQLNALRKADPMLDRSPYGPFLPPGWTPPPTGFGRVTSAISGGISRFNASPVAGIGLGLVLPAIGSNINEGMGGTTSGIQRGALSTGLNFAGTGAVVGSAIPVLGTLGGAAAGLAIGAFFGALSKATQSMDELATEIDQRNKKLNEEISAASSVIRAGQEISQALASGNLDRVAELRDERNTNLSKVTNPRYRAFLEAHGNDPTAEGDFARLATKDVRARKGPDTLRFVIKPGETTLGNFGYRMFGDSNVSKEQESAAVNAVSDVIQKMSPQELVSLRTLASTNTVAALELVGQMAGMSTDELEKFVGPSRNPSFSQEFHRDLGRSSIIDATGRQLRLKPQRLLDALGKKDVEGSYRVSGLGALSRQFGGAASSASIIAGANQSIESVRQQIALANPSLTDMERLRQQGAFGAQNIATQGASSRADILGKGKEQLAQMMAGLNTSPEAVNALKGINGRFGLGAFASELGTTEGKFKYPNLGKDNGEFMKALRDLMNSMDDSAEAEKENTRANNASNELLQGQLALSKTAAGAQQEITGAFKTTRQDLQSAIRRRDPLETIESARYAARGADINALRFYGLFNDQQYGSAGLNLDSNRAYGQRLRQFQYTQGRTSGTRIADYNRNSSLGFDERLLAFQDQQGRGSPARVNELLRDGGLSFQERLMGAQDAATASWRNFDPEAVTRDKKIEAFNLNAQRRVSLGLGYSEGKSRLDMVRYAAQQTRRGKFTAGADIEARDLDTARELGLQGDSRGSLIGGFQARFAGIKRDIAQFADLGNQVAHSLEQGLGNAFGDFITGAKKGKDAFRDFAVSVLGDASRLLGQKAMAGLLSFIPGFSTPPAGATGGEFTGSAFHFASGGMVPAMLTGGEFVFGPQAARRIGPSALRKMNGYAGGGLVTGGSGVRDDVMMPLAPGSFVMRKGATERMGPQYLAALASGQVQHRALGGFIGLPGLIGALLGGGLGYLAGGKKGAIGGALLGGIGGGLYGRSVGAASAAAMGGSAGSLGMGAKAAIGLGASAGLGLLAAGIGAPGSGGGPISLLQVNAYRQQQEQEQATLFQQNAGKSAYLSVNPWGGYSLGSFGQGHNSGGEVSDASLSGPPRGGNSGGGVNVGIKVDVHNNGTTTSTSTTKNEPFSEGSAGRFENVVRGWVSDELVRQSRPDGYFSQKGRYTNRF